MTDSIGETTALIEQDVAHMLEDGLIELEHQDTAKLLLCAINFGCKNIDNLAFRAKLPRDTFVRPRARRMRASGLWNDDGSVTFEYMDGPPEYQCTEFILHVLTAEGEVECVERGDKLTPAGMAKREKELATVPKSDGEVLDNVLPAIQPEFK